MVEAFFVAESRVRALSRGPGFDSGFPQTFSMSTRVLKLLDGITMEAIDARSTSAVLPGSFLP